MSKAYESFKIKRFGKRIGHAGDRSSTLGSAPSGRAADLIQDAQRADTAAPMQKDDDSM